MKHLLLVLFIVALTGCKERNIRPAQIEPDSTLSYLLYIGTYTEKEAHVDGKAEGIYVYRMNSHTGKLSYVSTSPFTVNPSFLDISNDGKYLFAVNETGGKIPGGVSAFRITGNYEQLEFINQVSSEGDYPCYIEIDKNGNFILAANYGSGTVALVEIEADGSLNSDASIHKHEGKGTTSRQASAHAHCIMSSPDRRFAYSADLGTDKIYIYSTNNKRLELTGIYEAADGSGPRHLAFHPDKSIVYSINELNGTIECMYRDTLSGMLRLFQTVSNVSGGAASDAGSADIHLTPAGDFLYATNRGNFNNITVFRVDDDGKLRYIAEKSVKGKTPRNFAIDPSGRFLLVANQNSDQVVTFRIDPVTGRLADTGIESNIPTPVCIKFLPAIREH
jgi:6-phosphogluconolactonase